MKMLNFFSFLSIVILFSYGIVPAHDAHQEMSQVTTQEKIQKSIQQVPTGIPKEVPQGIPPEMPAVPPGMSAVPPGMSTVPPGMPGPQQMITGTMSGQIMIEGGGPLSRGMVFFFNKAGGPAPSQEKYWRIPDHIGGIDDNGRFSIELPVGEYYLGAMKRTSERDLIGPPSEGDLFYAGQDEQGTPLEYSINAGEIIDIGIISGTVPFSRSMVKLKEGITAIEGTILDSDNSPVAGALVYAFVVPTTVGRPLFVSDRTGEDGTYILRVHEGGKYFLKVRDIYGGGPPITGAVIGGYGEKEPVPVDVNTGEIKKGIDIKIARFLGRGPKKR